MKAFPHLISRLIAGLMFSLFLVSPAFPDTSFEKGLSLYHQGNAEAAFNVFRDLHLHQPTGSGKYLYFMALSSHHLREEHDALRYLNQAIQANPSLSFAHNRQHVLALRKRLEQELSDQGLQIPQGARTASQPLMMGTSSEHHSSHLLTIALVAILAIGVLLFVAGKTQGQKNRDDGRQHKKEMEETGARLMAAVDKLRDEKNYYLLDHPEKKTLLENAFERLDQAYTGVLNYLRTPDGPSTNWTAVHQKFEEALTPVDQAILEIRNLMGDKTEMTPSAGTQAGNDQSREGTSSRPAPGDATFHPEKCVFCGADARDGRTISLERDGKVAYARACPKCLSEMDQNYQRTGNYAPPPSFYQGGMPFMGGGMSFGDMMLLDWMMHSEQQPVHVDMSGDHPADMAGGGYRDDRQGSLGASPDAS
ncbi:MAG: hypothetical protein M1297_01400 [Nitrospirae bacterium]|jgi:hypothetical protein|nr:hypothetical protein [Nitrospirota bacterium]